MKTRLIKFLLFIVDLLTPKVEPVKSITLGDLDIIMKTFPVYKYREGTSIEATALALARSDGEQRVVQFITNRIKHRAGTIIA